MALDDAARTKARQIAAAAPPLTDAQRDRLRAILAGADMEAAGPAPPGPAATADDPLPATELSHVHRTSAA